ncbi:MAG TPA: hypothetical protein VIN59_07890 [Alphaproteobacteria bacterium]
MEIQDADSVTRQRELDRLVTELITSDTDGRYGFTNLPSNPLTLSTLVNDYITARYDAYEKAQKAKGKDGSYERFLTYALNEPEGAEQATLSKSFINYMKNNTRLARDVQNPPQPIPTAPAPVVAAPEPIIMTTEQLAPALNTESTKMDNQEQQVTPKSLEVNLNEPATAELQIVNFLSSHWDTDTMGEMPRGMAMFPIAQELLAKKREELDVEGAVPGTVELLALDASDKLTAGARLDVGLALNEVNKRTPKPEVAPIVLPPATNGLAPAISAPVVNTQEVAPKAAAATSTVIPEGATPLTPAKAQNFSLDMSQDDADLEKLTEGELDRYWDPILDRKPDTDRLGMIAKALVADARSKHATGTVALLEADDTGVWKMDTLDRVRDAALKAEEADDIPAISPAVAKSPAMAGATKKEEAPKAKTEAKSEKEEETSELSGEKAIEPEARSALANLLVSSLTEAERDMVKLGTVGAINEPVGLDADSLALFIAMHPGFANDASFINGMKAVAQSYGFSSLGEYLRTGGKKIKKIDDPKAVEENVDLSQQARQVFLSTSPLGKGATHPDLQIRGFAEVTSLVAGKGAMKNVKRFFEDKERKLVFFGADGTQYVDDGYGVKTIMPGKRKDKDGNILEAVKFGAAHAINEMGLYIGNRLRPNEDGSPQYLSVHIQPKGMGSIGRMNEVRDMSLISALHHAQKNDLRLRLTIGTHLMTTNHPMDEAGHLDFKKLSPSAVTQMARYGISAEKLVAWYNENHGAPKVELSEGALAPERIARPDAVLTGGSSTPPATGGSAPDVPTVKAPGTHAEPAMAASGDIPRAPSTGMDRLKESEIAVTERESTSDAHLRASSDRDGLNADRPITEVFDEKGDRVFGAERRQRLADLAEAAEMEETADLDEGAMDPTLAAKAMRRPNRGGPNLSH